MKILITGADGMLGSHVVRDLLKKGHEITALVLPGKETGTLDGLPIKKVEGNILELALLKSQFSGMDWILHAAANVQTVPPKGDHIREVNVQGTKNVIEACLANDIKRAVFLGTAISFGFGSLDDPGNENKPYKAKKYGFDYMDSKEEALRITIEAVDKRGLNAVIVCPTMMFGKFDRAPNAGRMIQAIATNKLPAATPGGKNFLNAEDASVAVVNAFTMGEVGHCYILGNENLSYKQAFEKMAQICNVQAPKRVLPKFMVLLYGGLMTFVSKFTRKHPVPSLREAMIACDEQYFDVSKAIEHLQLPTNPIENGFKAYLDWCKHENIKFES